MSDPLALTSLALAAGDGMLGDAGQPPLPAQQWIAAGLTLLQRSAPLVRALSGRRSLILLPASPLFATALAASEGRAAVLASERDDAASIALLCADATVGAALTIASLADRLPSSLPHVLLDDAPRTALVVTPDREQVVDLGSHHGLALEGERDVAGRDEDVITVLAGGTLRTLTHRDLLADARGAVESLGYTPADRVLALVPFADLVALTDGLAAPLLAGATVATLASFEAVAAGRALTQRTTVLVATAEQLEGLVGSATRGTLALCVCVGAPPSPELAERWEAMTGVAISSGTAAS